MDLKRRNGPDNETLELKLFVNMFEILSTTSIASCCRIYDRNMGDANPTRGNIDSNGFLGFWQLGEHWKKFSRAISPEAFRTIIPEIYTN